MIIGRLRLFAMVIMFSLFSAAAHGDDRSVEEQQRVFTNQDIKQYQLPSDAKTKPEKGAFQEDPAERRRNEAQRINEAQEMEYWCKKASAYKKKIEKAEEDVKEIEQDISEKSSKNIRTSKNTSSLQKSLEKARKRLKDSEEDLADLEQEAHRKGAKPGWLRCQT